MKLIMERWDRFLAEQFEACEGSFSVGDFKLAVDISGYLEDQEKMNAREAQIRQDGHWRNYLEKAKKLAAPLVRLGLAGVGAVSGPVGAPLVRLGLSGVGAVSGPVGAAAAAVTSTGVEIGEDQAGQTAQVLGKIFMLGSTQENNNAYQQFLETFCVDQQTLDLIEDKFQKAYIEESNIVEQLKTFFENADDNDRLPDITNHLVDWLNTESVYKTTDDTKMVAT